MSTAPMALSRAAFFTLLFTACLFGANHVAARLAFNHGLDVASAVAVRRRPSRPATSCWVSASAAPNTAAAAMAKATPAPMRLHCPAAPRPEAAPSASSASARPNSSTGMATSTARSGRWR